MGKHNEEGTPAQVQGDNAMETRFLLLVQSSPTTHPVFPRSLEILSYLMHPHFNIYVC